MPGILRVNVDAAGGTINTALVPSVIINGQPVAVVGAHVASHGKAPHDNATMAGHSTRVLAGGLGVCRAGDAATCGDVGGPGSANVLAG